MERVSSKMIVATRIEPPENKMTTGTNMSLDYYDKALFLSDKVFKKNAFFWGGKGNF